MRTRLLPRLASILIAVVALVSAPRMSAQQAPVSASAAAQITALMREKALRTPAQRKMDSQLVYAVKQARLDPVVAAVPSLQVQLPDVTASGVAVDVRASLSDGLLQRIRALGGEIVAVHPGLDQVRVRIAIDRLESLAALPEVRFVAPRQDMIVFTGSRNSEGDRTHRAFDARATYGVAGTGVKVGVLSDGVSNLAASQSLGDLGPVTVLSGQGGSGDEGTAMLEIVHDLAPAADLYFATADGGPETFAQNIRALQAAGCAVIVDDVRYFVESPFQDGQLSASATNGGVVTQAVKDVAAAGVLYFSSAGNSGNKNDGTSGTWEGDFVDGGPATGPLTGLGRVHLFGGLPYDTVTTSSDNPITLHWSDPLGASANDYDIYLLDSSGTMVVGVSDNQQSGTEDPYERMPGGSAGQRVVIVLFSGVGRFLHLDTYGSELSTSTSGETHGHAATTATNSFAVAAVPAPSTYPNAFNAGVTVETFSSDGPRRIFFTDAGVPLTPGNVSSTGGALLQKPDLAAADGVSVTGVGGFPNPFYGTSAAAPHAAAIAALVKSRRLAQTAAEVRAALLGTAIDIEQAGVDRDAGYGIVMADRALAVVSPRQRPPADFDGDGRTDLAVFRPAERRWLLRQSSTGAFVDVEWGEPEDIPVSGDYDGDGRTDIAVFRPSNATWYLSRSAAGPLSIAFGLGTDQPVPADYDGDGRTDLAVFRRSSGTWFIQQSTTGSTISVLHQADVPVPADYDADGRADVAAFNRSGGTWTGIRSSLGGFAATWGEALDIPVPGDYDGDGYTDLAVFRPSNATWYISASTAGSSAAVWGRAGVRPVPGDYDGDGRTDLAFVTPASATWEVRYSSTGATASFVWGSGADVPAAADFTGDSLADITVYRGSNGNWYKLNSTGSPSTTQWGGPGDVPVPGNYIGDTRDDIAVYRPTNGTWYILETGTGAATRTTQWGAAFDRPVPADYDGDGKTDIAVFRPSNGTWYIVRSGGGTTVFQWGGSADVPVPADYDGDGKADIAIYRPASGRWFVAKSGGGTINTQWGSAIDVPVAADYDGDDHADLAVFRPADGTWYILRASGGTVTTTWGNARDLPVPADYDADGRTDIAVFRPATATWYVLRSQNGAVSAVQWGSSTNIPIPQR